MTVSCDSRKHVWRSSWPSATSSPSNGMGHTIRVSNWNDIPSPSSLHVAWYCHASCRWNRLVAPFEGCLQVFMRSTWRSTYWSSVHNSNGFPWRRIWFGTRSIFNTQTMTSVHWSFNCRLLSVSGYLYPRIPVFESRKVFMTGIFCAISICCAASRATWSFARDKAIPYSAFFSKVNHGFLEGVPLSAYLLSTTVQVLLGLIFLGSSTAFNAFVGVAVMCLGVSYALPVLLSVLNRRREVFDAPYSLGRWGYLINCIAVLWVFFEMVLFSMPAVIPVTSTSMSEWGIKHINSWFFWWTISDWDWTDYASVVFVGFASISAAWYIMGEYKNCPEIKKCSRDCYFQMGGGIIWGRLILIHFQKTRRIWRHKETLAARGLHIKRY